MVYDLGYYCELKHGYCICLTIKGDPRNPPTCTAKRCPLMEKTPKE